MPRKRQVPGAVAVGVVAVAAGAVDVAGAVVALAAVAGAAVAGAVVALADVALAAVALAAVAGAAVAGADTIHGAFWKQRRQRALNLSDLDGCEPSWQILIAWHIVPRKKSRGAASAAQLGMFCFYDFYVLMEHCQLHVGP